MRKNSNNSKGVSLWIAVLIILVTIYLFLASYLHYINVSFIWGPFRFSHWLAWVGTTFIILYNPTYYVWKHRNPKLFLPLLRVHVFGNLISVALITVHFAGQISRPPQTYPQMGTGIVLYAVMLLLVVTGFVQRFRMVKNLRYWRSWHVGTVITFYLVILVHILHGLKVI
jgi:hypothetical protein